MSYVASGSLGLLAGALTLGAVHLEVAAGNDLLGPARHGDAGMTLPAKASDDQIAGMVNRSMKGDRQLAVFQTGGITLAFKVPGVSDTSILMHVPAEEATAALRKMPVLPSKGSSSTAQIVACEPVVSILAPAAKQLAPGRCIT